MMKKISNKNMLQQLAQALFGTIAVKIPLNKDGTFAAPIRATAKVVESLLKFANKRSFNLFVFASALALNAAVVSEAFSCTVSSNGKLKCNNHSLLSGSWTCDTATATCANNRGDKVTYDPTTRTMTSHTYSNGIVFEYTYDTTTGTMTSSTRTNSNGSGYVNTYDTTTGKITSQTKTYSDGTVFEYTYDQNTGKMTSYARTNSDGSGEANTYTYDPTTGRMTSATYTNSNGSGHTHTYDPNTGKTTSYTQTNSNGSGYAETYDPNTGIQTSHASTDTNGYTRTTTYDGNAVSDSHITGRTLTDSNGQPVNGTVTSGGYTYTAENGVYTGYTQTNSNGSGYAATYDPNTGKMTSHTYTYSDGTVFEYTYDLTTGRQTSKTRTNSDGSGYAYTYDPNTGRETSYAHTDANGYTRTKTYDGKGIDDSNITGRTLTDSNGQPVNGTVTSGEYTYTAENGVLTGYTHTNSDGSSKAYTYDPTTGKTTSYTQTNSNGSGYAETYDPTTGRRTSLTRTNSDGSVVEYAYDPTTGKMTSETYYDAEGNPINGISKIMDRYIIAENGKVIARIDAGTATCNSTSDGLSYCNNHDTDSGRCAVIIKNSSGRIVGTQICKSGGYCWQADGYGKTASDCTTQFYSSDGKVIATYGADGQPEKAYDYDGDGNKLVYDDQCAFVGKLDADGNSIYDVGDGLSSENRRTHYTPVEAAEIIGNSDDNMIVMYFK